MTTLSGIDVSGIGQGAAFNWDAYRGLIAFAMIKATESTGFFDPDFDRNWKQAAAEGLTRGAYHFLDPGKDGAEQARWFLAHADPQPGDLVMLDHETPGASASVANAAAAAFCDVVKAATGAWPVVYTDLSMAGDGYCYSLGMCPLFIANPSRVTLVAPIGPWRLVSFEQTGQNRGVDTDVFYGSAAELARLSVVHAAPPPRPSVTLHGWRLVLTPGKPPAFLGQTSADGHNWRDVPA